MKRAGRAAAQNDREIAADFLELFRRMKRYVRGELPPFVEEGMNEEKVRCLGALRFLGRSGLKTLAAYDGLSSSSQCILLGQLVDAGLVSREEDSSDRRNVFYDLTDRGLGVINSALAIRTEFLCGRLTRLEAREKERFAKALTLVLATLDRLKGDESAT